MSTNQTSSTYQAVDRLRPAEAFTLAFPGHRAPVESSSCSSLVLFNSDIATDSDNVWTDGPTVDAHVFQGWVYDYYFKRFGRHGMDDRNIEVDSIVHPLARSEANRQPPDIVGTFINNALYLLRRPARCSATATAGSSPFSPAASTSSRTSGRTASPISPPS